MTPDGEVFAEIVDAAREQLWSLPAPQVDAWVSSALGLWRTVEDPDPADCDTAFLAHLAADADPTAELVASRVRALLDHDIGAVVRAACSLTALAIAGTSVALELEYPTGEVQTLFADVDADRLVDLRLGPPVDELVEGDEGGIVVTPADPVEAAAVVATAWRAAAEAEQEPSASWEANDVLARAVLGALGRSSLPRVHLAPIEPPATDPEADRAALVTLRAALGDIASVADDGVDACAQLVRWVEPPVAARNELEALASLEWADWLGAVIGLVRAGEGAPVTAASLVDLVNRCPEVTSTIPAADRDWFEAAFGVVLDVWVDVGVVDQEGRLTPRGVQVLPAALVQAWS